MSDILASIDAAVGELCACGCGNPLPSNGPSGWFIDATHQRRWQERQATNPGEVYSRQDAARVYIGADDRQIPLEEDRAGRVLTPAQVEDLRLAVEWELDARVPRLVRRPAPEPPDGEGRALWVGGWRMATSGPVTFRRWCGHCQEYRRPVDGVRAPVLTAADFVRADDLTAATLPELRRCDLCSHCHTPWPGPTFVAQARQQSNRLWYDLRLSACDREVRRSITGEIVRFQPEVVDYAWGQMVAELVDDLTYRYPCMVDGCSVKARSFFTVRRPIEFLGRSWPSGDLDLCPQHESELWSTTRYPYPVLVDPALIRPAARRERSA